MTKHTVLVMGGKDCPTRKQIVSMLVAAGFIVAENSNALPQFGTVYPIPARPFIAEPTKPRKKRKSPKSPWHNPSKAARKGQKWKGKGASGMKKRK